MPDDSHDAEGPARRKRAGGRAGNAERRGGAVMEQMPWRIPVNRDRPIEPLDEDGVARIHDGSMRILEEIGIEFLNEEAIGLFRQAGATVNGTNVRMGRDWVMEMVSRAPAEFTITPRNPDRAVPVGGRHILFAPVASPPSYWDMEVGRKVPGTRAHCADLFRLTQHFNCIHFAGGYPVEPVDIHPSVRHLDVLFDKLTITDKVAHAYSLGRSGSRTRWRWCGSREGCRRTSSAPRRGCTPTSTRPRRSSTTSR
jgi:trimethylamine--corrinoid protein Co-methyltransferase